MGRRDAQLLRALLPPLFDPTQDLRLPSDTHDQRILAVARHHRLSPALAAAAADRRGAWNLSPHLMELLQRDRLVTLGRGTLLRQALVELLTALDAAAVQTVVLKGMAYEQLLYPVPGTRPATDIDLLIPRPARSAAFEVFRGRGFQPAAGGPGFDEPDYHEVTFRRGDIYVDLHVGLAPFVRCPIDYGVLWRDVTPLSIDGAPAYALSRPHAAVNHTLHMAIHHFDVPGLYLLDLARLLAPPTVAPLAMETATRWRCLRAWQTSTALMSALLPAAGGNLPEQAPPPPRSERVIAWFGGLKALPRHQQLRRKLEHFDTVTDAARYLLVQGRRVLRERWIGLRGAPSAAARLGWSAPSKQP